jgi:parallel beta-helix repeat protein
MLSLLVASALALAHNVQPVKSDYAWTELIYIRADGSISPPTAPISSVDNVTYTLTDNIAGVPANSSAIIIQRENIIIDGVGHTLQGTQAYDCTGIELTGRSQVTIKNMRITAFWYGILLSSSNNNTLSGNTIANNYDGVRLDSSSNNTLSGNNITVNYGYGINLDSSNNNSVSGNNITANYRVFEVFPWPPIEEYPQYRGTGYGICLNSSSNNSVSGNNIANNLNGIELDYSSNNSISGNNITANYALYNQYYIVYGTGYGIQLDSSSNGNIIYHNNLVDNTVQAVAGGSANVWDDGHPSGGNYWSSYNGTDVFRGMYQNETGSDGIGDMPYGQDRYPLMNPWTSPVSAPPSANVTLSGFPIEPIYLIILAALAIIIAVGAVTFIVRRKKKPSEEAKSPQI